MARREFRGFNTLPTEIRVYNLEDLPLFWETLYEARLVTEEIEYDECYYDYGYGFIDEPTVWIPAIQLTLITGDEDPQSDHIIEDWHLFCAACEYENNKAFQEWQLARAKREEA